MSERTTLIMPALNEAAVIGTVIQQIKASPELQAAGLTEVIVVDNGSDDGTAAIAAAAGARVVVEPRRGYGRACLAGVLAASDAEIVALLDADGSDVPADIARVWEPVGRGMADLAVGSRTRGACEPGALTPQQRAGNAVGAALLRLLYGVQISDLGPLRAVRRTALLGLELREMTYGWSTEMLAKAGRRGWRVVEVPVDYRRRAGGASKVAGTVRGSVLAAGRIMGTIGRYARWQPHMPRRALALVAREPVPGRVKTRLGRAIGLEAAAALYAAFLRDLAERFTAAGRRDGYDLWWYAAEPNPTDSIFTGNVLAQEGDDLGARLKHGFAALHARGYDQIVILGTDSPQVPAAHVRAAFAALDARDVVLGPTRDGGYYLLGQRGAPADLFTGITMSTATVAVETCRRAALLGRSLDLLPLTFDVDYPDDLAALRAALALAPSTESDLAPHTLAALERLSHAAQEVIA
jgi:rSAM/selenodomain-associated transferase 1